MNVTQRFQECFNHEQTLAEKNDYIFDAYKATRKRQPIWLVTCLN
jgi:hypothetical protein